MNSAPEQSGFSQLFAQYGDLIVRVCNGIAKLPSVHKIILFGSYAKGTFSNESDVDLAVFFDTEKPCLLEEYRAMMRVCKNSMVDIQAQPFHASELLEPCGIVQEVVTYGVEIQIRGDDA